ncbi:hypothetical protein P691DRAFT_406415 [Macrolepiota fuliginosa MF-IS2]|uniref:Uncharacterized protein n=1 Tax=Macrolepiota fuliginosa MF-IS2 TaxID=1400762 RepID=A0A9P5X544_9AGAR|nr:hypothetical protein P691DRAFT_406415 [Macrolepiota fuliginosa MF-IS2]
MSYPFEQFTAGESYSTPPTPIDGYPQWETVEREQEQHQLQQHQQHQQQHQQSQEQPEHSPTQPTPAYQLIHLEDAHSQHLDSHQPSTPLESGTVDNTPIHLHHVPLDHRSTEGRLESTRNNIFGMFGFIDHAASSSSASGAAKTSEAAPPPQIATGPGSGGMAVRSARSTRQYHQSLHPYQRSQTTTPGAGPSSVTAAAGPSRSVPMSMREAQVSGPGPLRFVHHNLAPVVPQLPVTTSVVPSAMPSPASAPGRMVAGFGSVTRYASLLWAVLLGH